MRSCISCPRSPVPGPQSQKGFTLAALVIALALVSIFLAIAVESVSFQMRREREEELIFRGGQWVEAIRLFRARNGRFPINLKEIRDYKPRVLRQKWIDPVTGKDDWVPVFQGQEGQPIVTGGGPGTPTPTPTPTPPPDTGGGGGLSTQQGGPIVGVRSPSCKDSIKVLDGRSRYCEWKFYFKLNPQTGTGGGAVVPTAPPKRGG